jgi:hypothetical protein
MNDEGWIAQLRRKKLAGFWDTHPLMSPNCFKTEQSLLPQPGVFHSPTPIFFERGRMKGQKPRTQLRIKNLQGFRDSNGGSSDDSGKDYERQVRRNFGAIPAQENRDLNGAPSTGI